jgi:hypothetical protein
MIKTKSTREYQMYVLPPRTSWKMPVGLTRKDAVTLGEELNYLISEMGGALFTYPDDANGVVTCRFEFHEKLGERRAELRLGLLLRIGQSDVPEIEAYVYAADANGIATQQAVFPERVVQRARERASQIVQQCLERRRTGRMFEGFSILHLDLPYRFGLTKSCCIADGRLLLFPTRVVDGRRVSAVAIRSAETSKEAARISAVGDVNLLAALLTLSNGGHYQIAFPQWPTRQRRLQFIADVGNVGLGTLYPRGSKELPVAENDGWLEVRANWMWSAMHALRVEDAKTFKTALFAFFAGRSEGRNSSTLSIIANVAALNKLAEDRKRVCDGHVSCSNCGSLSNFSHNVVGDSKAITELVVESLRLNASEAKEMKQFLSRIYSKQRSSFVHGAELRHQEYGQGGHLHSGLPSLTGNAQDVAQYQVDLQSIMRITRRVLIAWLAKKSGMAIDSGLFEMADGVLIGQISAAATLGLQPRIMSVVDFANVSSTPAAHGS